jgi:hypothetical protein
MSRQTDFRMDISCFPRHSPSLAQATKLSPIANYEGVLTTKLFLIGQYAWRTHATKTQAGSVGPFLALDFIQIRGSAQ